MRISRVVAANWRNFKTVDFPLSTRLFIVGPNASGKSNLLDILRFLADISRPGGSLTAALESRGGLSKVRSLFARNYKKGQLILEIHLEDGDDRWMYRLAIRGQRGGKNLPVVSEERVEQNGIVILERPDAADIADADRLTQTHLEQISANQPFRVIADYFSKVSYFHLVPQLIRDASIVARPNDPYGSDFIARINGTPQRTRNAWLGRLENALQVAVPEFASLAVDVDSAGHPHLHAGYKNWRSSPAQQSESEFSDGTLRLIGLLWTVVSTPSNGGVLLLEEPELSLNSAIVRTIPTMLATLVRDRSTQIILSTHAPELLDDEGVRADEVLVLRVGSDGTKSSLLSEIPEVRSDVEAELPLSDIVSTLIAPDDLRELARVGRR